jgi:hypothetical protein
LVNGRRPPFVESGRRPYFLYSEDDHRLLEWKMTGFVKSGRRPHLFFEMEDDLNLIFIWKTTSSFNVGEQQPVSHSKTTSPFFLNGRRPQFHFYMEDNLKFKCR